MYSIYYYIVFNIFIAILKEYTATNAAIIRNSKISEPIVFYTKLTITPNRIIWCVELKGPFQGKWNIYFKKSVSVRVSKSQRVKQQRVKIMFSLSVSLKGNDIHPDKICMFLNHPPLRSKWEKYWINTDNAEDLPAQLTVICYISYFLNENGMANKWVL